MDLNINVYKEIKICYENVRIMGEIMKKSKLAVFFVVVMLATQSFAQMKHGGDPQLKTFMSKFGTWFASLELMYIKEKQTDWEVVDLTVKEMQTNLENLKAADTQGKYQVYTTELSSIFMELEAKARKRNKQFFKTLDKLDMACFKCHAANRPSDFPVKQNNHISSH